MLTFLTILLLIIGVLSAIFICVAIIGGVIALIVGLFYVIADFLGLM